MGKVPGTHCIFDSYPSLRADPQIGLGKGAGLVGGGCGEQRCNESFREWGAGIIQRTANGAQRVKRRSRQSVARAPAGRGIQGLDVSGGGGARGEF